MSAGKKAIREAFRTAVFKRDRNRCVFCPRIDNLDAHHITDRSLMPAGGYVAENGITLCPDHHLMAERFHISGGTEWESDMHPDDLYRKIGSSHEKAIKASEKLLRN